MITKIYVPDIECDSCVKLISKKLDNNDKITSFKIKNDCLEIVHDELRISQEEIIKIIKDLGFRASTNPFERKTLKERIKDVKENKQKYQLEINGIYFSIATLFILFLLEGIAYFGFLRNIPDFIQIYGWWILYLNVSIVAISIAMWHFYSYRAKFTCMVGMMIGMTFGMQTGMMIGAIIGATNGFFIGSLTGMLLGSFVGALTGKCCGIMGIMEGLMAGIMGGTMGPMISVMMFSDHLLWFMPVYMVLNCVILFGMSYMLYEEVVEGQIVNKKKIDFTTYMYSCIVFTTVIMIIMLYAPKSALLG